MEIQELREKYVPLIKQHWLVLALGLLGLIFFSYGLISLFFHKYPDDIIFETSKETLENESVASKKEQEKIVVDIEGAVMKPGVYTLPINSRVQDGLIAAGGLTSYAQRTWIAKNINLAQVLKDGIKLYIPYQGEIQGSQNSLDNSSNTININTASKSQLDSLSGVGEAMAQKIIDNRPYNTIEDLVEKKVVSKGVFEKIKERITVY